MLKKTKCFECGELGHLARNCKNRSQKKTYRPPRHKAAIAPSTALYELLDLDNDGSEQTFLTETDHPQPICNVAFVGMTWCLGTNQSKPRCSSRRQRQKRRRHLRKLQEIFAGLVVGPGRALTDTAAQVPTMGTTLNWCGGPH